MRKFIVILSLLVLVAGLGSRSLSSRAATWDPWFTVFGPPVNITNTPNIVEGWPSVVIDEGGSLHLAFEGSGSIYYTTSGDSFHPLALVSAGGCPMPLTAIFYHIGQFCATPEKEKKQTPG